MGPSGRSTCVLALDTGSTWTVIAPSILERIGCAPDPSAAPLPIVTASGIGNAQTSVVSTLVAMGTRLESFRVVAFPIPPQSGIRGLLGLDFLRRGRLEIDFPAGVLDFSVA